MVALSAGCLCHNNVTLTFDLLTPKANQFIFVPTYTNDNPSTDTGDNGETWTVTLTE